MVMESPAHLFIGTDMMNLADYDKAPSIPETQETPFAASPPPQPMAEGSPKATTSLSECGVTQSSSGSRHIYRIEYIDNTGTVIAVKKGTTPPAHQPDGAEDSPVFELVKRIVVFAKGSKVSGTGKGQSDRTVVSAGKENKSTSEETVRVERKHSEATPSGAIDDSKQKTREQPTTPEDDKLKDFDISPESNTTWFLKIVSGHLIDALRAVVDYYPGLQLLSHDIQFSESYKELIHHMDQLKEYKERQPADHPPEYQGTCKEHIDELLGYINNTFKEKLDEEYMRHKRDIPICTFPYLWLLFKPGEQVYWNWGNSAALSSLFIVESVKGGFLAGTRATSLKVVTFRLDYNAEFVGRTRHFEILQPFDGEKPIHELKMFPMRFFKEDLTKKDTVPRQAQLLRDGMAFFNFCKTGGHYRMLKGRPLAGKGQNPMVHGRVVVDMDQCWEAGKVKPLLVGDDIRFGEDIRFGDEIRVDDDNDDADDTSTRTGCRCVHCGKKPRLRKGRDWTKFDKVDPDGLERPDDDLFYRLCSQTVYAYLIKDRKWEMVHIHDLHEIEFDEHLLEYLVLPQEVKHTVQALAWNASQRTVDTYESDDYIGGKGSGQIILLHGAPGVGKTATAECVAELVKRPLISLTCGDLGTDVMTVEKTLQKCMSWGEKWNGVVLLDEADVYLESRTRGEIDRNALVSVFLRELERYQGIMFLTTNRIGTFDDAFLSRVHVGLLYKALSDNDREKVWTNNFERLQRGNRDPAVIVHRDAESYVTGNWKKEGELQEDLINIKWNGREIRNALQTALALASYETNAAKKKSVPKREVVLRAEHIQSVVKMSRQFKVFIDDTKKSGDEDIRARNDRLRGSADGVVARESSFKSGTPTKRRIHSDD